MKNKEWISVEDRLPKRGKAVLVHDEDGSMSISYRPRRSKSGEEAGDDGLSWYPGGRSIGFTTHWMELPNPPEVTYPEYPGKHKRLLSPGECQVCDMKHTYFCKTLCVNGF